MNISYNLNVKIGGARVANFHFEIGFKKKNYTEVDYFIGKVVFCSILFVLVS